VGKTSIQQAYSRDQASTLFKSEACIEKIEYYPDRKLDKAEMLRLATCKYIEQGHHIILEGASGNGKTWIANALGNAACRKFKSVRYIRMPELLDDLMVAKGTGTFNVNFASRLH
jgi:DNA replication protein DnaC